jgi:hypothetical protein
MEGARIGGEGARNGGEPEMEKKVARDRRQPGCPLRPSFFLRGIDKPAVHCPHNSGNNGSGFHDNSFCRTQPERLPTQSDDTRTSKRRAFVYRLLIAWIHTDF